MSPKIESPMRLLVRCVAEPIDGQWQAFSLEFGLAAQAETYPAARQKLDLMIREYLYDALVGEDREHAAELLNRKATLSVYAKYYCARAGRAVRNVSNGHARAFREAMPLAPSAC